jgi:hypothetical protein
VHIWGAWNEPDLYTRATYDPLYHNPTKAALLWKKARSVLARVGCSCTLVAGEFAEYSSYVTKYETAIRRYHLYWTRKPNVWGLHDYHDVVHAFENITHDGSTIIYHNPYAEAFVQTLGKAMGHPRIMLSEQGVELKDNGKPTMLEDGPQAEQDERQIIAANNFYHLFNISRSRIELVDYYLYKGPTSERTAMNPDEFDSGLIHGKGVEEAQEPREAYCVIALGEKACPPSTTTQAIISGTTTSSTGTALLTVEPGGLPTEYRVEYGTTTGYGHATTSTFAANPTGTQSETVTLTGLTPCTTYHYQAEAESSANEGDPSLGGDKYFTTSCVPEINPSPDSIGPQVGYNYHVVGETPFYYFWPDYTGDWLGSPTSFSYQLELCPNSRRSSGTGYVLENASSCYDLEDTSGCSSEEASLTGEPTGTLLTNPDTGDIGGQWAMVPASETGCSGKTAWRRMDEWDRAGLWDKVHDALLAELNSQGAIDWTTGVIDGSSQRAVFGGLTPARRRPIAQRMASRPTL